MVSIKLDTDQLRECANTYQKIAKDFDDNCNSILLKIAEYDNVWKGTFTQDLDKNVKKLKEVQEKISKNSIDLVNFINGAVDLYIKVDRGTATEVEQALIGTADYPNNVKVSEYVKNEQELRELYDQIQKDCDTPGVIANNPSPYSGKSCVSVSQRKAYYNGFNLYNFSNLTGRDGYKQIKDTDQFSVTKYSTDNESNALKKLVDAEGQPIANIVVSMPHPHTIYIDKIENGIVYFSDNTNPGKAITCPIDTFPEYKGSGYNVIGVAHLKKK